MRNIFIAAIIFLSVTVQTSFLPNFFAFGAVPDIALILIIIWTAKTDFNSVLKWAILAGAMVDLASYRPVGMNIFSYVVIAFAANSISKRFLIPQVGWRFFTLILMVFFGTLLNSFVLFVLVKIFAGLNAASDFSNINQAFFIKSAYDAAVFAIIYWPLEKIEKILAYYDKRIIIQNNVR